MPGRPRRRQHGAASQTPALSADPAAHGGLWREPGAEEGDRQCALGRRPNPSHPGQQRLPHSPATGDRRRGPQRPLACLLLSPSRHVGRSWGQAGTGRSQGRGLEEEHTGLVRTAGRKTSVGGSAQGTSRAEGRARQQGTAEVSRCSEMGVNQAEVTRTACHPRQGPMQYSRP